MNKISKVKIIKTPLVNHDNYQRIDIKCKSDKDVHIIVRVFNGDALIGESKTTLCSGAAQATVMLPSPEKDFKASWQIIDKDGNILYRETSLWKKPREWELYCMVSSHTDMGLHNSNYIQRYASAQFIDDAIKLNEESNGLYKYVVEGTWIWNNYTEDKGTRKAKKVVKEYVNADKIGICGGISGIHTQTYGIEELCRSTYGRKELEDKWNIRTKTMTMIDNNGMSWSMIQPYAEAGYENIIFAPNQWNPNPSTIWHCDKSKDGYIWSPAAGGGGARIDMRFSSNLPMVFYWGDKYKKHKMLIWANEQYEHAGREFGLVPFVSPTDENLYRIEKKTSSLLMNLEEKVPYDLWLFCCYGDDQKPNMSLTETLKAFNKRWKWPHFKPLSNPDEPFEILKSRFDDSIPTLCGDITGGWYQHPIAAAELLSSKMEADRKLATAEKLSVIASMNDSEYLYPHTEIDRAWRHLMYNDEHSYGTSGYQGRRVFETWMQHRDWIEKAHKTADAETERAINCIAQKAAAEGEVLIFNPTLLKRSETVEYNGKKAYVRDIPSLGYKTVSEELFASDSTESVADLPVIENEYYIIKFKDNGAIKSVFDKELNRELLDNNAEFACNEFIYTNNNHKSFTVPAQAEFKMIKTDNDITV